MFTIPKLSAPLTKAIRTSEGIIVWLSNMALAAGAIVEPSKLPPKTAAIVAGALTLAHVASRTVVKVTALQQGAGIGAPIPFNPLPSGAAGELDQLVAGGVTLAGTLLDRPSTAVRPDGFTPAQIAPGTPAFDPGSQPTGVLVQQPAGPAASAGEGG